jgi:TRAP-type uncharacterized transport system fused permease subunit
MRTGFAATRFGWSAFVVPFLFVFEPSLLLQGTPMELVHDVGTAVGGVWLASMGLVGYSMRPIGWPERAAYFVAGILLLVPASLLGGHGASTYLGIAFALVLLARDVVLARRARRRTAGAGAAAPAAEPQAGPR